MAGIEERRVFHDLDRGDHRIKTGAPALENGVTRVDGFRELGPVLGFKLGRQLRADNDAGPAMNHEAEGGIVHGAKIR